MQFSLRSFLLAMVVISFYLALFTTILRREPLGFQLQIIGIPVSYVCGFVVFYYFSFRRRRSREEFAGRRLITLFHCKWSQWQGILAGFVSLVIVFVMFIQVLDQFYPSYPFRVTLLWQGYLYLGIASGGAFLAAFWYPPSNKDNYMSCDLREHGFLEGTRFVPWGKVRDYEWSSREGDRLHFRTQYRKTKGFLVPPESRERVEEILKENITNPKS